MKSDTDKLSARQRLALPIIAAEPTVEGAAQKIGVTRKTLYEWQKRPAFTEALEAARKEFVESGFRTMRLATKQAATKIIKHMDSANEKVSLQASERVIQFSLRALELEELERRISALEKFIRQGRNGHGH